MAVNPKKNGLSKPLPKAIKATREPMSAEKKYFSIR